MQWYAILALFILKILSEKDIQKYVNKSNVISGVEKKVNSLFYFLVLSFDTPFYHSVFSF
jgi:hypothetical protein